MVSTVTEATRPDNRNIHIRIRNMGRRVREARAVFVRRSGCQPDFTGTVSVRCGRRRDDDECGLPCGPDAGRIDVRIYRDRVVGNSRADCRWQPLGRDRLQCPRREPPGDNVQCLLSPILRTPSDGESPRAFGISRRPAVRPFDTQIFQR